MQLHILAGATALAVSWWIGLHHTRAVHMERMCMHLVWSSCGQVLRPLCLQTWERQGIVGQGGAV
jgi:hypothetical protein